MIFFESGPYSALGIITAISVVFSLLNCFLGYKLLKLWITLTGFALGFLLGLAACSFFHAPNVGIYILAAVLLGVGLALVAFFFYKVGVFMLCALSAASVALSLISQPALAIVVAVIAGIGVGILGVVSLRPVVILSTGIGGGLRTAIMGLPIFGIESILATTVLGVLLSVAGTVIQFRTNPKEAAQTPPAQQPPSAE